MLTNARVRVHTGGHVYMEAVIEGEKCRCIKDGIDVLANIGFSYKDAYDYIMSLPLVEVYEDEGEGEGEA